MAMEGNTFTKREVLRRKWKPLREMLTIGSRSEHDNGEELGNDDALSNYSTCILLSFCSFHM